jgi:hypothetical protein
VTWIDSIYDRIAGTNANILGVDQAGINASSALDLCGPFSLTGYFVHLAGNADRRGSYGWNLLYQRCNLGMTCSESKVGSREAAGISGKRVGAAIEKQLADTSMPSRRRQHKWSSA